MSPPLRRSRLGYFALAVILDGIAPARIASADEGDAAAQRRLRFEAIPRECRRYLDIPDGARGSPLEWQQALSFAACIQDGSIPRAYAPEQLEEMVDTMLERLELPMTIYVQALAYGPEPIQLRAAFQIGMAAITLSTRARSAIPAPPELAANPAATRRYRELHDRLEPFLVRMRRTAWISFNAIDQVAAQESLLRRDRVERHIIAMARRMLVELNDAPRSFAR